MTSRWNRNNIGILVVWVWMMLVSFSFTSYGQTKINSDNQTKAPLTIQPLVRILTNNGWKNATVVAPLAISAPTAPGGNWSISCVGCLTTTPPVQLQQKQVSIAIVNGTSTYTLPDKPLANTVPLVSRNGIVQKIGFDYTLTGDQLVFSVAATSLLDVTDDVLCVYFF